MNPEIMQFDIIQSNSKLLQQLKLEAQVSLYHSPDINKSS
jgi:hypothetical protein